jgi:hypothetical protein
LFSASTWRAVSTASQPERLGELAERLHLRMRDEGAKPASHGPLYPWQTARNG